MKVRADAMKKWMVVGLLAASSAWAQNQPASEAVIREYLAVSKSKELVNGTYAQMDKVMRDSMRAAAPNGFNEAQTRIMDELSTELVKVLQQEMGWEKLEPDFIRIYQATLTQSEVEGMVTFYKSEAGQALIAKMPAIMEQTMALVMQRVQAMRPRMQKLQAETVARMEKAGK